MTAELALATTTEAATLADKVDYAKALAPADLLPPAFRGKPANVLLAMEAGVSLNKTAIEIMQNAHVINGKLGFSAEFQRALVLQSGHKIRVFMDGDAAVAQGVRSDDPGFTYEVRWDVARARTAGLNSDNWKKHQPSMLKARATTELCRDAFADVIRGYRSVDELQEMAPVVPVTPIRPGDTLRAAAGLPVEPVEDDDIADAEIVAPDAKPITQAQIVKMHACFSERKWSRDQGLAFIEQIVGFPVESSKILEVRDASAVIDALENGVDLDA